MTIAVGQPINAADLLAIQTTANAAAAAATQLASTVATAKTEADTALAAASSAQQAANSALASATPGGLPDGTVAANISGVQAPSSPVTLTALLDAVISRSVGAIMTRSSAGWTATAAGHRWAGAAVGRAQGQPVSWVTLADDPRHHSHGTGRHAIALTFGTATSTTQPLTISAATGTVTSYQVKVSTASGMTFPSTWSTIRICAGADHYWPDGRHDILLYRHGLQRHDTGDHVVCSEPCHGCRGYTAAHSRPFPRRAPSSPRQPARSMMPTASPGRSPPAGRLRSTARQMARRPT
jgi:hypothetical protein